MTAFAGVCAAQLQGLPGWQHSMLVAIAGNKHLATLLNLLAKANGHGPAVCCSKVQPSSNQIDPVSRTTNSRSTSHPSQALAT